MLLTILSLSLHTHTHSLLLFTCLVWPTGGGSCFMDYAYSACGLLIHLYYHQLDESQS